MDDVMKLLERQAAWQKGRKTLPWPEKIRIAEAIRESILQIRSTGPGLKREAAVSGRTRRSS
jgi:hypothetical protein